jgi:DNA-binding GntR family transcriptional regulator
VVAALRRRDPDAAARAMHTHIDEIAELTRRTIVRT